MTEETLTLRLRRKVSVDPTGNRMRTLKSVFPENVAMPAAAGIHKSLANQDSRLLGNDKES